jgi:hypothetical protein
MLCCAVLCRVLGPRCRYSLPKLVYAVLVSGFKCLLVSLCSLLSSLLPSLLIPPSPAASFLVACLPLDSQ